MGEGSATIGGVRRIWGPVVDRVTYRRWAYLILGGALTVPYLLFAAVLVPSILPVVATVPQSALFGLAVALAALAATSLIPGVRALEGAAVRELLGDPVPDVSYDRLAGGLMFALHVVLGGVVSTLSLVLPVLLAFATAGLFTGEAVLGAGPAAARIRIGWQGAWIPAALLLALVGLVYLVWLSGEWCARAARRLLRISPSEQLELLRIHADKLAERNRLARELHDSVGHALSVVTVQAGAARRTMRTDPEFTEQALHAIENSARAALDDLDHVLGLLRDEPRSRTPQPDLAQLPALLSSTGLELDVRRAGELDTVPAAISREAYRLVQESLTNVLRHAGKVPVTLMVKVTAHELVLRVVNPLTDTRPSGRQGSGLRGMAERVHVLRGDFAAGPDGGEWAVAVRLGWGSAE